MLCSHLLILSIILNTNRSVGKEGSFGDVLHEGYDDRTSIYSGFFWNTLRQADFDGLDEPGILEFVCQIQMFDQVGYSCFYSIFYAGL